MCACVWTHASMNSRGSPGAGVPEVHTYRSRVVLDWLLTYQSSASPSLCGEKDTFLCRAFSIAAQWDSWLPGMLCPSLSEDQGKSGTLSRCASFQANLIFKTQKLAGESLPKRSSSYGSRRLSESILKMVVKEVWCQQVSQNIWTALSQPGTPYESSSPQGVPERDMGVGLSGQVLAGDILTQCQGSS